MREEVTIIANTRKIVTTNVKVARRVRVQVRERE